MLELRKGQRAVLVDKLPDLANVAAGAMTFGQFLGQQPVSLPIAGIGLVLWFILMGVTMGLARSTGQ